MLNRNLPGQFAWSTNLIAHASEQADFVWSNRTDFSSADQSTMTHLSIFAPLTLFICETFTVEGAKCSSSMTPRHRMDCITISNVIGLLDTPLTRIQIPAELLTPTKKEILEMSPIRERDHVYQCQTKIFLHVYSTRIINRQPRKLRRHDCSRRCLSGDTLITA